MSTGRILRIAAAAALLVGGLIHLDLYFGGYRAIPDIGRGFLLNAIASGIIGATLVARREPILRLAGIALAAGTIVGFVLSRRGAGLFNFREQGLNPSPQAALALFVEIAAIVALGLTFVPAIAERDTDSGFLVLGAAAAVVAIVLIGFGVRSASDARASSKPAEQPAQSTSPAPTDTTVAGAAPTGAGAVTIRDFSFNEPTLTVAKGTTLTWTNADGVGHSVNAADNTFNSKRLEKGGLFSFTFETVGEFAYVCDIHPYMSGKIIVTG